jgi:hypothetical protein
MKDTNPADAPEMFEQAVEKHFRYLEIDFSFVRTTPQRSGQSSSIVRFESKNAFVSLRYGAPSFEVKLWFGRLGLDEKPDSSPFEAGDLTLPPDYKWAPRRDLATRIEVEVEGFARLLRDCAKQHLLGETSAYEEMKTRRDTAVAAWRNEEKMRPLQEKLTRAWVRKEYTEVVNLFAQLQALGKSLTPYEEKQLTYARKHTAKE